MLGVIIFREDPYHLAEYTDNAIRIGDTIFIQFSLTDESREFYYGTALVLEHKTGEEVTIHKDYSLDKDSKLKNVLTQLKELTETILDNEDLYGRLGALEKAANNTM